MKKGVELTMNTMIVAILVIIVLIVVTITFGQIFGKQRGIISCNVFYLTHDLDKDGVADAVDKCPCPESGGKCPPDCNTDLQNACDQCKQDPEGPGCK